MRVRELMSPRVFAVRDTDPVGIALQTMLWAGVRHLPVLREDTVVGILSERDVLRRQADVGSREALTGPCRDAMTSPVEVTPPDAPVDDVAARMATLKIGCMPVVDDGTLVGMVTATDLLARQGRRAFDPMRSLGPTVGALMSREPASIRLSDGLIDAAERMSILGVRHLPVLDEARHVVGILSDRDVRLAIGGPPSEVRDPRALARIRAMRVVEAMTAEPLTLATTTPLSTAVRYLVDWRIGAIPVVDDAGHLVGILSYVDALRGLWDLATAEPPPEGPRAAPRP